MLEQDDYFSAAELGLEELNPFISCNISEESDDEGEPTGKMLAILTVQEDFQFHRKLDHSISEEAEDRYFLEEDEDFAPRPDVELALHRLIEERYNGENMQLDDTGGEWFQFDLVLTVERTATPEDIGVKFWEESALVQFHNEADPGTFGSEYLFGSLMTEMLKRD